MSARGIRSARDCSAAEPYWLASTVRVSDRSEEPGPDVDHFLNIFVPASILYHIVSKLSVYKKGPDRGNGQPNAPLDPSTTSLRCMQRIRCV